MVDEEYSQSLWGLGPLPRSVLRLEQFTPQREHSGKGSQRPPKGSQTTLRTRSLPIVTISWNTNCTLLQKDTCSLSFKRQELDNKLSRTNQCNAHFNNRTISIPDTERGLHGEPQEGTGIPCKDVTDVSPLVCVKQVNIWWVLNPLSQVHEASHQNLNV